MSGEPTRRQVKVCHVAMGDLWAGAEVQLAALVGDHARRSDLHVSVVLFNEGRLAAELRGLGVPVIIFPEGEWSGIKIVRALLSYCRAERFDLLHTHKYKDNILGSLAAARAGVPCVVRTMHGLAEPFRGLEAFRMRVNEYCDGLANRRGVHRLIAVSAHIEQVLSRKYGREKVVQIHNGISFGALRSTRAVTDTRCRLGLGPASRLIGTVGRLTAVKGHTHFLLAAKQLLEEGRDLRFALVGDGPLLGRLREEAKALGVDAKVAFLGHRDDTADLIRAMDILVLPSLHEGIPMVLLEALALARPVVASRVGGIPEVIVNHTHGLLVPAGDAGELARACETFLSDPHLAERCGREGRTRVEQEFSAESMGAKVAALYHELVGRQPRGS